MNSTFQLDLHPDADSLNAFAEKALAAPEREQILAHLAGCSRCRQVIFLAQQAAADAPAPARVSAAKPPTQPGAWFWNWRIAWVPAAALAASLTLVITFHPRHTAPAPELAKVAPLNEVAAPAPIPHERVSAVAAHRPVPAAKSATGNAGFTAPRRLPDELAQEAAPSAALPVEPGTFATSTEESRAALPSSVASAQQEAAAQFKSQPAVTAWQQERQLRSSTLSASANATQVSQKSRSAEAYAFHASRPTAGASAGPRMQQQSTPSASFDIGRQEQLSRSTASRKTNPPKLPSGLAAVSRATAQNLVLEIDLEGALFLSGDSGEHWEPVARQWTGRAVEVRAKTGLSGTTATAGKFELKNEVGAIWVSADGKIWAAQ
jgi:hypothetical protein